MSLVVRPKTYERVFRKKRRNAGQNYLSTSSKRVIANTLSNTNYACKNKGFEQIGKIFQKKILGEFSAQNVFICGFFIKRNCIQSRPRDETRRKKSASVNILYLLKIFHVCKQYFLLPERARVSSRFARKLMPVYKTPEQKMQNIRGYR